MKNNENLLDTGEKLLLHLNTGKNIRIEAYDNNYFLRSKYKFIYQPHNEDKLKILRSEYDLEGLTRPFESELDKFKALRGWVRKQWKYGFPKNVSRDYDTLDILRRAKNKEAFWCSEYTAAFIQCALSLGYQARYVGLCKGHVVAEIWSNELKKWIVMDPTFNIHFEMDGAPLNCLGLYNAFNSGHWNKINVVEGDYRPDDIKIRFGVHEFVNISINNYPYKSIDYYADGFFIRMRNDWFTRSCPKLHLRGNVITDSVAWGGSKRKIPILKKARKEEDIYYPLNVTTIILEEKKGSSAAFNVILRTFTPNYSHYIVDIDENQKKMNEGEPLVWILHTGSNSLKVASVNHFGVKGVVSHIGLYSE